VHVALWREDVRRARVFGRYPALLVSLHADTIYARHFDLAKASPENAKAVRDFLDQQHRFQTRTVASLRADPKLEAQASPETIEHNRLLIAALDRISLEICWGVKKEIKIQNVPTAGAGTTELRISPATAKTSSSIRGLSGRPASRFALRASACAAGSRRRRTSIGRWTRPKPHW
jgi:hypothetical protein